MPRLRFILPGLLGLAVVIFVFFTGRDEVAHTVAPPLVHLENDAALTQTGGFTGDRPRQPVSDGGPETQLSRILKAIEARNLNEALKLTDTLIQQYPNYRLAHLIKGDLLLARTRPLEGFGAVGGVPAEQIEDLRAEALKRLRAYRDRPAEDQVPRYLLQLRPDQRYAVVVDTERSRLYIYENDRENGGRPRYVADFYVSQGKLGSDKFYEGDKKTPIGVYHVTADLSQRRLPDLYGVGAFPINYPNEWDRRRGRGGSGIWLHGTPSDTFARPPLASDGCVVLTNQDLEAIRDYLQVGLTPVIISHGVNWLPVAEWEKERQELSKVVETWRADWESRDMQRYLAHYSRSFKAGGQDYAQFAAQKQQVNAGKTWIKLGLKNVSIFRNPGQEEVVVVSFDQDYSSNNLSNRMKKRQYWLREGGQWKIIYEGAA